MKGLIDTLLKRHTNESQTAKILRLLKKHKTMSNFELNNICYRYGARIFELRREGHLIISEHVKGSYWLFHYKGWIDPEEAI